MLVDTHAHLDCDEFENDRGKVVSRSLAAGVGQIITVGIDLDSSRKAIALAEQNPCIRAAVGIHPHEAARASRDSLIELARLGEHKDVVAIGEIGLDFYRNLSPADKQGELFVVQLELARQVHKPVLIHDRQAHAEVMAALRENARGLTGVLHCFSGDRAMAEQAVDMGFYVSFGGPVTFQNASRLQQLVRDLPLDFVVIETDCPFLAPHPHRGRRNEPAYLPLVAARIAALKQLPTERVAEVTTANARRLFGLAVP